MRRSPGYLLPRVGAEPDGARPMTTTTIEKLKAAVSLRLRHLRETEAPAPEPRQTLSLSDIRAALAADAPVPLRSPGFCIAEQAQRREMGDLRNALYGDRAA